MSGRIMTQKMLIPQRINSIQSKVRQIHGQLQRSPAIVTDGKNEEDVELGEERTRRVVYWLKQLRKNVFKYCAHQQVFNAHFLKLTVLLVVSIAHLLFVYPFLELFHHLEQYTNHLGDGAELLRHSVHDLTEYSKNMWMTACVLYYQLSTTSISLFFLPTILRTSTRKWQLILFGILDFISFGSLPVLFLIRIPIIHRLQSQLSQALEQAHKLNSAEKIMNELQCTVHPRERLPYCSDVILRALFPTDLVKFLLVLCAMTIAYLTVAYIIYWCIKHWIPHQHHHSGNRLCPCCCAPTNSPSSVPYWKNGGLGPYSPLGKSAPPTPKFFAYSPPPLVVLPNPLVSLPSEQCSPIGPTSMTTTESTADEPIPSEPEPSENGR